MAVRARSLSCTHSIRPSVVDHAKVGHRRLTACLVSESCFNRLLEASSILTLPTPPDRTENYLLGKGKDSFVQITLWQEDVQFAGDLRMYCENVHPAVGRHDHAQFGKQ